MNREIKFRVWNGNNIFDCKEATKLAIKEGFDIDGVFIPFYKDYTLMQFTGLKDKNGVDIYEGDVLQNELHKTKTVVKWIDDYACFCGETVDEIVKEEYNFYQKIDEKNLKIIGNIYENPELIC